MNRISKNRQAAKRSWAKVWIRSHVALFVTAISMATIGSLLLGNSFAAYSHSPIGNVDSCTFSNGTTNVYGWAHDPDAAAGALPQVRLTLSGAGTQTLNTDSAFNTTYREGSINKYLTERGIPTSRLYGYRASFSNLYKGGTYKPSGTVLNVGAGSDSTMSVTVNDPVDDSNKPFFKDGKVPDGCLATRSATPPPTPATPTPTPTTPPPTPAPTPTPAPKPTPTPARATTNPTPAKVNQQAVAPVATADGAIENVSLTTKSNSASFNIKSSTSAILKLEYNTANGGLTQTSGDTPVTNQEAIIAIKDLAPATEYQYKVTGTNTAGKQVSTDRSTFKTLGYTVDITFQHDGQKLADIPVLIRALSMQTSTNQDGIASFEDIPDGSYTMYFSYNGQSYSHTFSTTETTEVDGVAYVSLEVDPTTSAVEKPTPATAAKPNSNKGILGAILVFVAAIIAIIASILYLRHRRRQRNGSSSDTDHMYSLEPPEITPAARPHANKHREPKLAPVEDDRAPHTGESLKSMVIQSLVEESKRRNNKQ